MGAGPTPQMNQGGNHGDKPVSFTLADAERINAVVQSVETGRRGRKFSTLPRAAGAGGGAIVTASFSGSWFKGVNKVLTVGDSTATVTNILSDVLYSSTTRKAFLTMLDGTYTVISTECS